jgi:translation initiation factor 3 subunit C
MHLISVMYDSHRVIDDYMDLNTWRTAFRCLVRVVGLLNENQEISLGMTPSEDATQASGGSSSLMKKGDGDATEETPAEEEKTDNKDVIRVVGTLETFLSRLEGEFTKSLQQINPHTKVSTGHAPFSLVALSLSLFPHVL